MFVFWHVVFVFLSFCCIIVVSLLALTLFGQEFALKSKMSHGLLSKMPSIETSEQYLHYLILISFLILTLTFLSGFFTYFSDGVIFSRHNFILGVMSYIVLAFLITTRYFYRLSGRQSLICASVALVLLWMSSLGASLFW